MAKEWGIERYKEFLIAGSAIPTFATGFDWYSQGTIFRRIKDKGVKSFVDSQTQDLSAFFAAMTEKNSKSFVARVLAPKVEDNIGESGTVFEIPSLAKLDADMPPNPRLDPSIGKA